MIVATSEGLFEVHAGGDQTGRAPFLVDRSKEPLSLCRKPDGRVLVVMAGYPEHDIRSIETGAWVAYAWGLGWTMGVTCEPSGATWAARYSDGPGLEVFDVAVGGDYAAQPAFAANVIGDSFQRSSTGELLTMSSPVSSSATGIHLLDDSFQPSSPDAFVEGNTQSFATLGGALLAAMPNGLIKDVSAGGSVSSAPTFATLPPQTTLLFARWEKLWAAQIESPFTRIYDITAGGTFGPGQEFVVVNGGIRAGFAWALVVASLLWRRSHPRR